MCCIHTKILFQLLFCQHSIVLLVHYLDKYSVHSQSLKSSITQQCDKFRVAVCVCIMREVKSFFHFMCSKELKELWFRSIICDMLLFDRGMFNKFVQAFCCDSDQWLLHTWSCDLDHFKHSVFDIVAYCPRSYTEEQCCILDSTVHVLIFCDKFFLFFHTLSYSFTLFFQVVFCCKVHLSFTN